VKRKTTVRIPKTWQVQMRVRLADGTERGHITEAHGDNMFDAMDAADLTPIEGDVNREAAQAATELHISIRYISG
jgi:hypothetical protein